MSAIPTLPRRPVPHLRAVFVLLGSALAIAFFILDYALVIELLHEVVSIPWITIVAGAVISLGPIVALGWCTPVRRVEAVAAESLLGVRFPDGIPGPARTAEQRARATAWFTLHLLAGALTMLVVMVLAPIGFELLAAPFGSAGQLPAPIDWVSTSGGWRDAWMPVAGVTCLLAIAATPALLGAVMALGAPTLLGPSRSERLHQLEVETARLGERNRIAREIHDSVGHALSLVTLQAVAARKLCGTDPAFADNAMATIETTARAAIADLDHMLGLLRDGSSTTSRRSTPDPDLTSMDTLVTAAKAAGLDVRATIDDGIVELPRVISTETYRIVQEGLTNALKHGTDPTADLTLTRSADHLTVVLRNPAPRKAPCRRGRGLVGMAERVHTLGGTITSGSDGQHWRMAVSFPLPKAASS